MNKLQIESHDIVVLTDEEAKAISGAGTVGRSSGCKTTCTSENCQTTTGNACKPTSKDCKCESEMMF